MKTLEDKLRELSLDELNKWTVKSLTFLETVTSCNKGDYKQKKDITCEHCKTLTTPFGYQTSHGDKCSLKGIDKESLLKDWLDGISLPQLQKKYGIPETSFQKYTQRVLPKRVRPCDELITCEHCHRVHTKSNHFRSHGDKCKLKGRWNEFENDIKSGMGMLDVRKKYGLAGCTIRKYKETILNNN